jgi:regulator of sigma E protease
VVTSIIGVVILLGGLIFFHEFGHYLIAKLFGVKVEVFSLGFGKKLITRKIGETQYCLSLFPLGGYVKLMGDDPYKAVPPEEADRAFSNQKLYRRFAIVAAGPLANLLLAYILYTVVFWVGQPTPSTRIGEVVVNSPAWEAGIRPKDRVVEVLGTKVQTWNDMEDLVKNRAGEQGELILERNQTQLKIPYTLNRVHAKNAYGEDEEVGGIKGILATPLDPTIGISTPESAAFKAGLRSGDTITKIGTREIRVYEDINDAFLALPQGTPVTITAKRMTGEKQDKEVEQSFSLPLPYATAAAKFSPFGFAEIVGIYPSDVFVRKVAPGTPAEKGGLKAGDRIIKVGSQPVYNFDSIVDQVQATGAAQGAADLVIQREGKEITLNLKPEQMSQEDPFTRQAVKRFMLGFVSSAAYHEPEMVEVRIRNPAKLVGRAFHEVNQLAERMLVSLGKLVAGQISVKNLGGPVLIASVAGKSLDAGPIPFLMMMAMISINLFLLNLFPIPVLDGGHLLFFIIEGIKGKPVSTRTMEVANQVGMVFILMLIGLTLFNDISRIVIH